MALGTAMLSAPVAPVAGATLSRAVGTVGPHYTYVQTSATVFDEVTGVSAWVFDEIGSPPGTSGPSRSCTWPPSSRRSPMT